MKGSEEAMCRESWEEKYTEEKGQSRRGDEGREEGGARGGEWDSGGLTPPPLDFLFHFLSSLNSPSLPLSLVSLTCFLH